MFLDPSSLNNKEMYKFLIGGVAPRPIAWAGTRSREGVNNLAPFSFFNAFSSTPPIVGFSTIPRLDGRKKDTLQNVIDSKCFTLSTVSHKLVTQMSKSAALLEPEEDEFSYAGLEPAEAHSICAPYVKDALLVFECELNQIVSFGEVEGSGNLILGQIRHIMIDDDIYQDGYVDFEKLDPVGRLAGNWYATIRDKFELKRG
jgi:flavin reductase (DIM6/NTAB) family NADH-FMN oxidoreductase RutF